MAEVKIFTLKFNKELWSFVKKMAVDREISMNELIIELLIKEKNKQEKK